ncbi:DpnII family type II restriction endonuclease ['Camptotheca acuminata' phytoplasma]|uniref:DpnII family type II restriction endonuclease n=1 Tax='Camptotheca acuminata' phytoplasma TaxID=3239192 RepID=UPI00351AB0C7
MTYVSKSETEFWDKFCPTYHLNPTCFKLLPFLISNNDFVRDKKFIYINDQNQEIIFDYQNKEIVVNFIKNSKILDFLFLNPNCKDIKTFIFGIKTGISSHDRKNKSSSFLPNLIKKQLIKKEVEFKTEIYLNKFISYEQIDQKKKLNFYFKINETHYLLECSFF